MGDDDDDDGDDDKNIVLFEQETNYTLEQTDNSPPHSFQYIHTQSPKPVDHQTKLAKLQLALEASTQFPPELDI